MASIVTSIVICMGLGGIAHGVVPSSTTTLGKTAQEATRMTVLAPSAEEYPGDFNTAGVRIRLRADTTSTVLGLGYPGDGVDTEYCAPTRNTFAHIRNLKTGVKGWVTASYISPNPCNF
ncbi:SH3 domain-containing protein [Actinosynnema sp. NPDC050436]|uniref:SH3 domain-containing protein n=1 Tax=Actinosynnema sp. NPDC050436 TaxID=3155659 RepID=UPI0033D1FBF4